MKTISEKNQFSYECQDSQKNSETPLQFKHFSDEIYDLKARVNYLEQFLKKQMNYQT